MSVCIILRLKNCLHVRSNDLMIISNHKSSPHDKEMIFELKNTSNDPMYHLLVTITPETMIRIYTVLNTCTVVGSPTD